MLSLFFVDAVVCPLSQWQFIFGINLICMCIAVDFCRRRGLMGSASTQLNYYLNEINVIIRRVRFHHKNCDSAPLARAWSRVQWMIHCCVQSHAQRWQQASPKHLKHTHTHMSIEHAKPQRYRRQNRLFLPHTKRNAIGRVKLSLEHNFRMTTQWNHLGRMTGSSSAFLTRTQIVAGPP